MGEGVDVEKILHDESLDSVDSPVVRQKLAKVFVSTFSELCRYIDEVFGHFQKFMDTKLNDKLWMHLLSPGKGLFINSWLSRSLTARGSGTSRKAEGPTRV